jgi:transposase
MSNFILTDRKTDYLLPPSVDDWLTQDHLARFVVEVIDGLNLTNLTRQYAGRGSKAHHPATLLALLVYGYSTGVFSSRKLEMATYDSVAFRYRTATSSNSKPSSNRKSRHCWHWQKTPIPPISPMA